MQIDGLNFNSYQYNYPHRSPAMRFPVRPLPANPSRVMALHHAGGGLRQQAPARASRPPIRSAGAPAGPRPKFSLAAPPARLAERRQRPRGRAVPGALGARELGHVLAINSSVFLVGYKALSSGLSNVGIAHAWFLGTVCLAAFQVQGYVLVCAYFVFGTLATKVGKKVKIAEGTYERNEGKRTPASVWGSGFAAAACALAALAFHGDGALCTTLRTGFVASFATKLSDTVASEIGKAYGRTTILITSLKPVPRGTDGAVSWSRAPGRRPRSARSCCRPSPPRCAHHGCLPPPQKPSPQPRLGGRRRSRPSGPRLRSLSPGGGPLRRL